MHCPRSQGRRGPPRHQAENILIEERHALVSDFGVAKALSESLGEQGFTNPASPSARRPHGPEQRPPIRTSTTGWTSTAGIVAYEMLTGDLR
jgi:serine/threonine protein kinase